MLVDSGKNGHGSRIKAIMDLAKVSQIDHLITTHYHEDHYGGIDELIAEPNNVQVINAYDRGDKNHLGDKLNQPRYIDYDAAIGNRAEHLTRGETIPLDPAMSVTCISSGGVVLGEQNEVHAGHENDMSVSLHVQFGSFSYFIGGDIELTTEGKIADRDIVMDVDAYQANHHGSHTSSSLAFMQDLSPSVIIISNGNHGGHKHPRKHTLKQYGKLDPVPVVYQTNKYLKGGLGGNVPDEFIADAESVDKDGTILVTVDQNAGNFTVSYEGHSKPFQIKGMNEISTGVVIKSLMPNPKGKDRELETVTLNNNGTNQIDMSGWKLQDESGKVWSLSSMGVLESGESKTIQRNGMAMDLNNSGDKIVLLSSSDQKIDVFEYTNSSENQPVITGH
jgi:competence protein ComEC